MSSTNTVNFSLRHNKGIERSIVFEGLAQWQRTVGIKNPIYVGFGSVWFSDFAMAHRQLGVETMFSIEMDEIVALRALYNRPFRTISVVQGESQDVIADLLVREDLAGRPWIVWLDYDACLNAERLEELQNLVLSLPANSTLITTFNARGTNYGSKPVNRPDFLRRLFGDACPDDLTMDDCKDEGGLMRILAQATQDSLHSIALSGARPGGFVPAFQVSYKDATPMVTVGAFLPTVEDRPATAGLVGSGWHGIVDDVIATPPLTPREITALLAQLPNPAGLTRDDVRSLGFDLEPHHIRSFVDHYLRYPSYVQVVN